MKENLPFRSDLTYISSLFSLEGKVALVTGAAGHLGRCMASALAGAGAHVILNGRRPEPLRALEAEIKAIGCRAEFVPGDVRLSETASAISFAVSRHGVLDILVNNSYSGSSGSMDCSEELYMEAFSSVVTASAHLTRQLAPFLEASGSASIINVASMYGIVSPDPSIYGEGEGNPPFYGAAKAALLQWTRYAAVHLAAKRIRVNAISPGPFPAPSVSERNPTLVATLAAKTPLNRVGFADELRGPVVFLASNASSYMTGANIVVDGGWTSW